jgi:lipopolysaccharide export system protein LptA
MKLPLTLLNLCFINLLPPYLLPFLLFFSFPIALFSAEKAKDLPITQPVYFSGDLLEASRKEGKVILTGNAYAKHGSTEIRAQKIEIFYDTDGKTVKEVNAYEQVRFVEPGRRGRSEKAQYLPASRLLILEGSPVLWEGEDELRGKRIFLYRDPDRVIVEGAQATVSPERLKSMNAPTETTSPKSP